MVLPAAVALAGIALSLNHYVRSQANETLEATERLAEIGRELATSAHDLQLVAIEQVLAIQALFETRSVTRGQFDHFVSVIGTPLDSGLSYAPLVTGDELDEFLQEARVSEPGFTIYGQNIGPRGVYWPLLFSSEMAEDGYRPGFDFGSDPAIRDAIKRATRERRPVVSGVLTVSEQTNEGALVIVAVVQRERVPIGIAVATLRLGELLGPRVLGVLGGSARLELDATYIGRTVDQGSPTHWEHQIDVAGQQILMRLDVAEAEVEGLSHIWFLLLWIALSLLIGWVAYDRSQRRAMVGELAALQQTLDDKDRFLASVSHQLRTPLTAVVGTLEVLSSRDVPTTPEVRAMLLRDARVSAQELERLVEDHLTAARLSAGAILLKKDVVDLDQLMARILASTDRTVRIAIAVGHLGKCAGDAMRIRQILRNLMRNADRFAISSIEVRAVNTPGFVTVEVLNDGDLISAAVSQRLFEPFVKVSKPGQPDSIGLGLSVSRDLARRMGGDLTYVNDRGRVRFSLSLPASTVAANPAAAPAAVA